MLFRSIIGLSLLTQKSSSWQYRYHHHRHHQLSLLRKFSSSSSNPSLLSTSFVSKDIQNNYSPSSNVKKLLLSSSSENNQEGGEEKETTEIEEMGDVVWADMWDGILGGGPLLWKVEDLSIKKQSLEQITSRCDGSADGSKLKIVCPMSGDDAFVPYAWSQGHEVVAMDLVPAAVKSMREQFGGDVEKDWTSSTMAVGGEGNGKDDASTTPLVVWKHKSGRATIYQGDILAGPPLEEHVNTCDAIYDKDAFGALPPNLRERLCQKMGAYTKSNAILYIEVVVRPDSRNEGPPFHVEKSDLLKDTGYGTNFNHIAALGEVYKTEGPFQQSVHVLQRKER